jgi:type VI secretion system protein ImpJ
MTIYLETCPVHDMHDGGGRARLDTLAYTPRLAFGPREADARGLFLVPVARIARAGEGARLAPFAPPAVRLYKDGLLRSAALEVLELLRAKGRELEEYKLSAQRSRERGGGREPSERALAVALGVALRHIARLHHLLNAPSAHPHQVYSAMSELASELGIFAQRGTGFSFRGWDQWDPGPAFLEMREAVARLLEEVSPGPNLSLVLRREGAKFECALPPLPEGELGFWIAARTQMHADEAKLAVPAGARLASPGRMAELVATGLPGVGLTPVRDAPAGLPRRADTVYFAVRDKDPMWEEAVREGRLELRWPDAPAKAQLTLVAVRF